MSELWLVRHGETEWSKTGQHTGRTDLALTAEGERQARQLRRRLERHTFSRVISSPLQRALRTCQLAWPGDAVTDDDLMEWDYGAYEGRTTAQIRTEVPGWLVWTHPMVNGESLEAIGARCDRMIDRALAIGGDVALFAHGHVLRIFGARWLGLPPDGGRLLTLDTASLSVLGFERNQRVIRCWNERSDLVEAP